MSFVINTHGPAPSPGRKRPKKGSDNAKRYRTPYTNRNAADLAIDGAPGRRGLPNGRADLGQRAYPCMQKPDALLHRAFVSARAG